MPRRLECCTLLQNLPRTGSDQDACIGERRANRSTDCSAQAIADLIPDSRPIESAPAMAGQVEAKRDVVARKDNCTRPGATASMTLLSPCVFGVRRRAMPRGRAAATIVTERRSPLGSPAIKITPAFAVVFRASLEGSIRQSYGNGESRPLVVRRETVPPRSPGADPPRGYPRKEGSHCASPGEVRLG